MALATICVHVVEQSPTNDSHQYRYLQGEFQLPPDCLGDSPRSAGRCDSGLCLGSGVCEILCATFKSGVSISHRYLCLLKESPDALQMFWGLLFFPFILLQPEEPDVGLRFIAS